MANELTAAETFMRNQMSGDSALVATGITGYFSEKAPNQQASPYIVWTMRSGLDVTEMAGIRINVQMVFLVRVVDRVRAFSVLQTAADRIDAVLHKQTGTALGHAIQACVRESPYSMVEDRGDVQWRHLGGSYRIWVAA